MRHARAATHRLALAALAVPLALGGVASAPAPAKAQPGDAEPAWYLDVADGECELFVQEFGPPAADTVIVLHGGWGAEHGYLLTAFEGLARNRHLVFYDQRGSLRSPCPDSLVSLDAHLADLDRLRRELGLDRVTLFGHSMGTNLALFYLRRHPDRVRGLVLAAASPLAHNAWVDRPERFRAALDRALASAASCGEMGRD